MSSQYGNLVAAFETVLRESAETPFVYVASGADGLADEELAAEINKLGSGNTAPAALVYFPESESNRGMGGQLMETLTIGVIVVAAGTSRAGARATALELAEWVRANVHYVLGVTGMPNPPQYLGQARFRIPNCPLTVSARLVSFSVQLAFDDVPITWTEPAP